MPSPHIVIIGAGFGGTYAARHLAAAAKKGVVRVTLINRTNYFLFTPLLHEVATGGLTPTSITEPLAEIFAKKFIRVVVGEATVKLKEKLVKINGEEITFDYLLITTGAETNFFQIPGAKEHTVPLKTVGDAMRIRSRVIQAFERARDSKDHDERRRLLSFVVVGAGPTGIELATELSEFATEIKKRYNHSHGDFSITLVSADKDIMRMLPVRLQKRTARILKHQHIHVTLGKIAQSVSEHAVNLEHGEVLPSGLTLWTAGVIPQLPKTSPPPLPLERGRILVDETLRVKGHDHIFAIGDAASPQTPVPMLAQAATTQARVAAENILASINKTRLKPFHFKSKGMLISLGQWQALGTIGPVQISGPLAWYIWRTVYLFKFFSVKKRFMIALEWTINLFSTRDITQLDNGLLQ